MSVGNCAELAENHCNVTYCKTDQIKETTSCNNNITKVTTFNAHYQVIMLLRPEKACEKLNNISI